MDALHDLMTALAPLLAELVILLLSPLLAAVLLKAQRRFGLDVEARHREALHSAIMTGVRAALDGTRDTREVIDLAVSYARGSVPDAVKALQTPDSVLRKLAEAKVQEALTAWLSVEETGETAPAPAAPDPRTAGMVA